MLVLGRKPGESVSLFASRAALKKLLAETDGDRIELGRVIYVKGRSKQQEPRIGFEFPREIDVLRSELMEEHDGQ